jgi:hypothetical protein
VEYSYTGEILITEDNVQVRDCPPPTAIFTWTKIQISSHAC